MQTTAATQQRAQFIHVPTGWIACWPSSSNASLPTVVAMTHIPSGRHTPPHLTDSEGEHGRSRSEFASSDTNPQTMHTIIRYCSTNALSLSLKTCAPAKRRHVWFFGQHQHSAAPEFRIFAAFLPHPEKATGGDPGAWQNGDSVSGPSNLPACSECRGRRSERPAPRRYFPNAFRRQKW